MWRTLARRSVPFLLVVLVMATFEAALVAVPVTPSRGFPLASRAQAPPAPQAADGAWILETAEPPVAERYSLAFDSGMGETVLFGGLRGLDFLNETWVYDAAANQWTNVTPSVSPHARVDAAMAYDPIVDRTVLFGGAWWVWDPAGGILYGVQYNDLWSYDSHADIWTQRFPSNPPSPRNGADMIYDPGAGRFILFGGRGASAALNETWSYDYTTNSWTNLTSSPSPPAGLGGPMVYDSVIGKAVLFGDGPNNPSLRATWTYDSASDSWTNVTAGTQPPGGWGMPMAFDPVRGESVLFGSGLSGQNQTWAFNATTDAWALLSPTGSPPPGTGAMVWDGIVGGIVLQLANFSTSGPRWSTWLYLDSETAPAAPRQLTAYASDGKVGLSWQPPAWDGGSPITNYTIYRGTSSGGETAIATLGKVTLYGDANVTNGQTYYYQVSAVNAIGEGPRSAQVSATPSAIPVDTTPPLVTITSPVDGATVASGTVAVRGTASDDVAVARVDISSDGITWIRATGTTSWSGNLNLSAGSRTIYVQATDTSGNHALGSITLNVVAPGSGMPTSADYLPYIGAGVVAAVVIACAAVVLLRRRKRGLAKGREPPAP